MTSGENSNSRIGHNTPTLRECCRDEWGSRTFYGKILFPYWFITFISPIVLLFLTFSPAIAWRIMNKMFDGSSMAVKGAIRAIPTPEVYKDDD